MKLGLVLGYWGAKPVDRFIELAQRAEALGFDIVCTSEAYGSDALTPLAAIATHTSRIKLGTAILQISARTPAMAAMSAITRAPGGRPNPDPRARWTCRTAPRRGCSGSG